MKILVTGPRQWTDLEVVQAGLDRVIWGDWQLPSLGLREIVLVHGGAQGFDLMCAAEAEARRWTVTKREADWYAAGQAGSYRIGSRFDRQAGYRRNKDMIEQDGPFDVCLAGIMECIKPTCVIPRPHASHGTMDCIGRALLAGITLLTVRPTAA